MNVLAVLRIALKALRQNLLRSSFWTKTLTLIEALRFE
jgi:hypothetical protein